MCAEVALNPFRRLFSGDGCLKHVPPRTVIGGKPHFSPLNVYREEFQKYPADINYGMASVLHMSESDWASRMQYGDEAYHMLKDGSTRQIIAYAPGIVDDERMAKSRGMVPVCS